MQDGQGAYDIPAEARHNASAEKPGFKSYWYLLRFSVFLLLLPFTRFYGCWATDSDQAIAAQAVTTIHTQMTHGDFDGIYNDADKSLQVGVTRDRHVAVFSSIVNHYGIPSDCTQDDIAARIGLGTKRIQAECTSRFSRGDTLVETFRFKKTDDQYRLYYYRYKVQ
jgi:hypothetical protein